MEQIGIMSVLKILGDFGTLGLVIFLWWADNKRIYAILDQYKADMAEQREMYKNNTKLVAAYEKMSSEHMDMLRLNISATTELVTWLRTRTPCHQLLKREMMM